MASTSQALPLTLSPEFDFDHNAASDFGTSLNSSYVQAAPFPHIVIDNFLNDELIANICKHFPIEQTHNEMLYERGYKGQLKRQISPNECSPFLKTVFNAFNSAPMLQFLEKLTGIEGLIPDPYFAGGVPHYREENLSTCVTSCKCAMRENQCDQNAKNPRAFASGASAESIIGLIFRLSPISLTG